MCRRPRSRRRGGRVIDPRAQIVGDGYDAIGATFGSGGRIVDDPRPACAGDLARGSPIALACSSSAAAPAPETQQLAARFRLTGVDLSPEQLARARAGAGREFVHADFTALDFRAGASFDAVVSFYPSTTCPAICSLRCSRAPPVWLVPDGLAHHRPRHVRRSRTGSVTGSAHPRSFRASPPVNSQLARRPASRSDATRS